MTQECMSATDNKAAGRLLFLCAYPQRSGRPFKPATTIRLTPGTVDSLNPLQELAGALKATLIGFTSPTASLNSGAYRSATYKISLAAASTGKSVAIPESFIKILIDRCSSGLLVLLQSSLILSCSTQLNFFQPASFSKASMAL